MPVTFDNDRELHSNYSSTAPSGIIGWMLRKGIVKSEQSANLLLFLAVVIIALLTFLVVTWDSTPEREIRAEISPLEE